MRIVVGAVIVSLSLMAMPAVAQAEDDALPAMLGQIFEGRPDKSFVAVVLRDPGRSRYMAFYQSTYLQLREIRAYVIPFRSADVDVVDAALATDDHDTAFASLLSGMRLTLGAMYVSDVNLDGIRNEVVTLGTGTIRDGFHHEQFANEAEADRAYREWVRLAVALIQR
jgi:hypothetical protein